jgi:hypothetical protein
MVGPPDAAVKSSRENTFLNGFPMLTAGFSSPFILKRVRVRVRVKG